MSSTKKNIHMPGNDRESHKQAHSKEHKDHEEHKPENYNKGEKEGSDWILYISIAIIVLVIGTIVGVRYFYNPKPDIEKYTYNGFEFRKLGDIWYVRVQPEGQNNLFKVPLHATPRDVKNISVVGDIDNEKFNKKEIYITFDPDLSGEKELKYVALSSAELSLSMAQALGAVPIAACSRNETAACADRPIKDCSSNDSVIYLKEAPEPKVTFQGSCVLVEGKDYDIVRATDRLLLWWYGIMRER